ncbi:hypothetical protein [Mesorhizobium sp. 1B3]|uniref:hypothetical protein n=1 Tax=Mesorhizobium sp. 1B3 TaxID=3243599 RepID=UPI003D97D618
MSVMLALLCLPVLAAAVVLSPVIVPVLFLLSAIVPGFAAFRRTSGKRSWNIASYHSPHSLTWRWLFHVSTGARVLWWPYVNVDSNGTGFCMGIASVHVYRTAVGWQFAGSILGLAFHFQQQRPMWFRDMGRAGIEDLAKQEYREGVSAGAAARQLCRSLGAHGGAPVLKRMLEDMLAEANRASHDPYLILRAFEKVDPVAAQAARMESFYRTIRAHWASTINGYGRAFL